MPDDNVDKTDLNKKDIEHLEEKIDNISSDIKRLDKNTPNNDDFQSLKGTVDKVLIEGNGGKPLTTKVENNKALVESLKSRVSWLYGIITVIFGSGITFVLERFTKLF